jgi:hypothetical protein
MTVKRKRREFGAPINFSDRNVADAKDGFIDCVAYEDRSFDLKRIELDKATQVGLLLLYNALSACAVFFAVNSRVS